MVEGLTCSFITSTAILNYHHLKLQLVVTQITQQLQQLMAEFQLRNLQCRSQWWNILLHLVIYFDKKTIFT